ncbi:hypothetical protein SO802_031317 [Lithocarpus litseifolius]|uniref:Uncharacterized protein n=1 Tax=Lithocarpus litseifolius TaxID=425828 RepID=A0AAW2BM04_9ROSI
MYAIGPFMIGIGVMCYSRRLYWITKRAGERQGSGLMKANAWHHRADAVSSVVALIGVGCGTTFSFELDKNNHLLWDARMGKKRSLAFVQVGEGPSRSRQRGEERASAHTAEQPRGDASDVGTQPPDMRRERPLTVVQVGQRASRSPESVQEELRAVLAVEQARGDADDDDETQPLSPDDLVHETPVSSNGRAEDVVQETPASSNVRKTRGTTLMTRIWSLPANLKIECELNVRGQPIGESGQTFTRWLGTFCLSHALCPLVPVAWTPVPQKNKLDCWIEIEKRWIIDPEIIQPANQISWALHLLGELRRNRRTKLKKKCYLPNALKEEVIGKIPRWADEQDYAALVDYWFLPSTKTLIDKNKSSRGFQKDIARSGPISFAQTADKMAKESGQAVERATLFAKVYSTKDGAPVSTAVKEKIDKMTAILNNGCTLHGERRDGILWAKDDAFAQVIGAERSGQVRGVGFGPTPSGRSGSNLPCYTSTPLSSTETANRMTSLENSHQSLRDELAQSEQRHKEEVVEIHAKHKEEIAEALAEAKRQSDAQHKEQLAEAKREFDAQHRVQMEDMMSSLKAALDHLSPDLSTLGYSGLFKESPNKLGDKVLSSLLKKMKLLSMLGFVSFHFIQGGVGGTTTPRSYDGSTDLGSDSKCARANEAERRAEVPSPSRGQ